MSQKDKIEEHFTSLSKKAHSYLVELAPGGISTFGDLMDYTDAILEKKTGNKVDLETLESKIIRVEGDHAGKALLQMARGSVNKAIMDIFGPSFYGKG